MEKFCLFQSIKQWKTKRGFLFSGAFDRGQGLQTGAFEETEINANSGESASNFNWECNNK